MESEGMKYSPLEVTRRMKLAEICATLWLDRALDYIDADTNEGWAKLEKLKRRVENLAPWRYGTGDPDLLFSVLEFPAIDALAGGHILL
jgi:hypothetical protein